MKNPTGRAHAPAKDAAGCNGVAPSRENRGTVRDCATMTFARPARPLRDPRGRFASIEALLRESIKRPLVAVPEPTRADIERWDDQDLTDYRNEKETD